MAVAHTRPSPLAPQVLASPLRAGLPVYHTNHERPGQPSEREPHRQNRHCSRQV